MRINMKSLIAISLCLIQGNQASADPVLVHANDTESFFVEFPSLTTVQKMKERLHELTGLDSSAHVLVYNGRVLSSSEKVETTGELEFWIVPKAGLDVEETLIPKKTHIGYRNYDKPVTAAEKKDIHFILKTLAQKSLASLWSYKSQLEYAGDRIDHVHPLRFLECIFTDDELIVYLHNIKKRGKWIWGEYIKGLKESLQDEDSIGNLTDNQVVDFSGKVSIDPNAVFSHIHAGKWENFVKTLIDIVPRNGDSGRYDQ